MNVRTSLAVVCPLFVVLIVGVSVRKLAAQMPAQYCSPNAVVQTSCNLNGQPAGTCMTYSSTGQCTFANAMFQSVKVYQYPYYECQTKTTNTYSCFNYNNNPNTTASGSPYTTQQHQGYNNQLTCQVQGYATSTTPKFSPCAQQLGVCQVLQYIFNNCQTTGATPQTSY